MLNSNFARSASAVTISAALVMGGCATASKDISANYVSPNAYAGYDCAQIQAEAERLRVRVTELGGRLDQAATNDKVILVGGGLLFWPALFALGGTKQQEAEYGRIKGEAEALQQTSVQKKCGLAMPSGPAQAEAAISAANAAASATK